MTKFLVSIYLFILIINNSQCAPTFCYYPNDQNCGKENNCGAATIVSLVCQDWQWRYGEGPNSNAWPPICKTGKAQSPINLPATPSKVWTKKSGRHKITLSFNEDYKRGTNSAYISNNGNYVQIYMDKDMTSTMTLKTNLFPQDTYIFGQAHCHWGSEHLMAGKRYPLECHFVHYNAKFANISHASSSGQLGSLLVIGVLYQDWTKGKVKKKLQNEPLHPLAKNLHRIRSATETQRLGGYVNIFRMILHNIYLPQQPRQIILDVHSYTGSLTTPDCHEGVRWLVLRNRRTLSKAQMMEFNRVMNGNDQRMRGNFRPVQPLNGRDIKPIRMHLKDE